MFDRLSRFDTKPGDIKVPARELYPSKPVQLQARWLVRMVVSGEIWIERFGEPWPVDMCVWASSSIEAAAAAREAFYAGWATREDRKLITLRITSVLQEAV